MSFIDANLQPQVPNVLPSTVAPAPYVDGLTASSILLSRWGFQATVPDGIALAATMRCDEEGPFMGVKFNPTQEREWPRTFKYGWPNVVMDPSPVLIVSTFPGAWYLNYEGVVPQQVVDFVVLECYRMLSNPMMMAVVSESVSGASVHYAHWTGDKGTFPSELDRIQSGLLGPFQMREAHLLPFPVFNEEL